MSQYHQSPEQPYYPAQGYPGPQQPYYPGPAQPYYPPPQPPRRRGPSFALVLAIVAVCFACIGGAILGGFFLLRDIGTSAADSPRDAVNALLTSLKEGDVSGAYDQLCASARQEVSRQKFQEEFQEEGKSLADFTLGRMEITTAEGKTTATVEVTFRFTDGETDDAEIEVLEEEDGWRVCPT